MVDSSDSALRPWNVWCRSAEFMVEVSNRCEVLGVPVVCHLFTHTDRRDFFRSDIIQQGRLAVVFEVAPSLDWVVRFGEKVTGGVLCVTQNKGREDLWHHVARDMGICAVEEVGPLVAAMALVHAGACRCWSASKRALGRSTQLRMGSVRGETSRGAWVPGDGGMVSWVHGGQPQPIGEPRDANAAARALQDASHGRGRGDPGPLQRSLRKGYAQRAMDVLLGPARALSDPASRAALHPFGFSFLSHALCTSPSRAAMEATGLGFPVRVTLTSPDLRVWDHPELSVDLVDSASRVREVFRQLHGLGRVTHPTARTLGVTVSVATMSVCLLGLVARPLGTGQSLIEMGFADSHGKATGDRTVGLFPSTPEGLERQLARLAGHNVLPRDKDGTPSALLALLDLGNRLALFLQEMGPAVDRVRMEPVAVLLDGSLEVREVSVSVTDHFSQQVSQSA